MEVRCAGTLPEDGAYRHGVGSVEVEYVGAVGHGFGKLEPGEVDMRASSADVAGTAVGWPSADQEPANNIIDRNVLSQANESVTCTRNEDTEHKAMHIPTHQRGRA
ncbi:hypothetical protein ERJ75_000264500 [Trypanosoma vivax]|nr:hypothetical protein ERJ75_000264500 [Trypanosoma vivax]